MAQPGNGSAAPKALLEAADRPVEQVGAQVGFLSPTTFRERFRGRSSVSASRPTDERSA